MAPTCHGSSETFRVGNPRSWGKGKGRFRLTRKEKLAWEAFYPPSGLTNLEISQKPFKGYPHFVLLANYCF